MKAYHGRFYDLYFTGLEGDVDFYVEEALEAGAPVLELGCGTGRILVPSALAGVRIPGLDLAAELLECIGKHLKKDGLLVFNTFDPLGDMASAGFARGLQKDTDFIDPVTGNRILVWFCRDYDPQIQLLEQELIYEEVDKRGQTVSRTCGQLVLRYTFSWEMQYLLERCGFVLEALYGDFQGGAFPGYGEQIWVARKLG